MHTQRDRHTHIHSYTQQTPTLLAHFKRSYCWLCSDQRVNPSSVFRVATEWKENRKKKNQECVWAPKTTIIQLIFFFPEDININIFKQPTNQAANCKKKRLIKKILRIQAKKKCFMRMSSSKSSEVLTRQFL